MTINSSSRWEKYEPSKNKFGPIIEKLEKRGKKILNITAGDPVLHGFANDEINQLLIKAVEDGWNMYSSSSTKNQVRNAIAEFEKKTGGGKYSPENILITPGTANALFVIHYSLLDSGDQVVAPDPSHYLGRPTSYWSCFGAEVIPCPGSEENEWTPTEDELRSRITEKTKAIFVNNPNNPTGAIYKERFLKNVVDIAGENDLVLIGDEIYRLITFDGRKSLSLGAIAKDVPAIVLNGFSKYFIRTGWRFGYICLNDPEGKARELMKVIKQTNLAYGHSESGVATPIIVAATMALESSPMKASEDFITQLQKRRDYLTKRLSEIEEISCVEPAATLYAFPNVNLIPNVWSSDEEFLMDLLKKEQILFNPGSSYGKKGFGHFRTLLMPKIEIQEEICDRLQRFIKKHRNPTH
jgi:aspartate/methionine/tyrosine aminotransferase